ncbi:hypothetical protein LQZ18_14090 [Lachnospiraceae bacterium ZAX-1]
MPNFQLQDKLVFGKIHNDIHPSQAGQTDCDVGESLPVNQRFSVDEPFSWT